MDDETDLLVLAASAWTELMEYRYCFTYGYRKQLYEICLSFSVQDFPHLAGFQYLKDIQLPKFNPPKTVEMILSGKKRTTASPNKIFSGSFTLNF